MNDKLSTKVKNMPDVPGVYIYKDLKNDVIYVGKAKNLKNRVGSYFQKNLDPLSKTKALVDKINDLIYIETNSELEALILEAELIKKYRPKYNIALKDDKSYLYIVIRKEKVTLGDITVLLPKVITERRPLILKSDISFGPYPDGQTAKLVVRALRKIIPFRDCSISKFNRYSSVGRPCLYGYIGLCQAPCVNKITPDNYRKDIDKVKKILSGEGSTLIRSMENNMKLSSKNMEYEDAAKYRDMIDKFNYIRQGFKTAQSYIDNPYLVEDLLEKSLDELNKNIPALSVKPERIECYDISNISGKDAVGSMVVAINGRISKSDYRKFKIKLKETPDDFTMMSEVLTRRLSKDNLEKWGKPDLIVLDGGKGQVSVVQEVLDKLSINIPLIGLAKRFETIVYKAGDDFVEINLPKDNEGLKLLQRLRDEAHRFGQSYHHKLRLKKISEI